MTNRDFDDFDEYAEEYRRIHSQSITASGADSDYFSEHKIQKLREHEFGDSLKILDLGCGDGNSAVFFRKYFADCEYFGIDTSDKSVAIARERNIDEARFERYNGLDIPFSDGELDVVFIACVLHHIDKSLHEKLIGEVRRVLKAGGRLYIFEHNPFNPLTRYVVRTCPFDKDAVLLTSSYMRKLLKNHRFKDVETNYTIFFPRHRIFRGLLGLEDYLKWLPLGGQYYSISTK